MDNNDHAGHRERLRARFRQEGLHAFAPHEVLELLLTFAISRQDTNPLAHALIRRFGSLSAVLEASPEELEQTPGIGPHASTLIHLMLPLLQRYEQEKLLPRHQLNTYADLAAYCRTLYLGVGHEQFYLLCFDAQLQLLATCRLSEGTPGEVAVSPRLILRELVRRDALGAVISHNHPSGSSAPSREDMDITLEIQRLLRNAGIRLYDHVLIAGSQDFSFAAHHLLDNAPVAFSAPADETPLAADRPWQAAGGKKK